MRTRILVPIALALLLVTSSGCWVWDELSAGEKEMQRYGHNKKEESSKESASAGSPVAQAKESLQELQSKWWKGAQSLQPRQAGDDLVRCRIGNDTRYSRSGDCRAQGGVVID